MNQTLASMLAIVAVVIAPLGAYLVAARRLSGKIGTSDASELWIESRSIREDYRDRIVAANDRIAQLSARVEQCEGRNNDLLHKNLDLREKINDLEGVIVDLKTTIDGLREELVEERLRP